MIQVSLKATITPQELKKIIIEYMEHQFGQDVKNIQFNVSQQYDRQDRPYSLGLDSVEVSFGPSDSKPVQTGYTTTYPPGMKTVEPTYGAR